MRRAWITACLLPLAACGQPPPPVSSASHSVVRASILLLDEKPTVGKPIRLRLQLANAGTQPFVYSWTGGLFGSVTVTAPDGKPAPYIAGYPGSEEDDRVVPPGKTVVLEESLDINSLYHVALSGKYRVNWGTTEGDDGFPPVSALINVAPGELSPAQQVMDRLLTIIPKDWFLAFPSRLGSGTHVYFATFVGKSKGDTVVVDICEQPPQAGCELLGRSRWGNVHLLVYGRASSLWPGCRGDIARALEVAR